MPENEDSTSSASNSDYSFWTLFGFREKRKTSAENYPLLSEKCTPIIVETDSNESQLFDPNYAQYSKLKISESGWKRMEQLLLKNNHRVRSPEFETLATVLKAVFSFGFLIGGLRKNAEMYTRWLFHNETKRFNNPNEVFRRKFDFTAAMFIKNGIIFGAKLTILFAVMGSSIAILSSYRNRFSYWYIPISTALSGAIIALKSGPRSMLVSSIGFSFFGSIFITSFVSLQCLAYKKSANSLYQEYRQQYYQTSCENAIYRQQIQESMKEHGFYLSGPAKKLLEKE